MKRRSITLAALTGVIVTGTLPASGELAEPEACEEAGSSRGVTTVIYGDSFLAVTPVTSLVRGKEWRFNLSAHAFAPDEEAAPAAAYDDSLVTIKGKTGTPIDSWLDLSGTRSDGPLKKCVPSWLPVGVQVFYSVTVESLGMLDPRGDVVN